MGPPPLRLDYAHNAYLVLSSSSAAPPAIDVTAACPPLTYVGCLGPGTLAQEHVYALEGIPSGSTEAPEAVERARAFLETAQQGPVQILQTKPRAKR